MGHQRRRQEEQNSPFSAALKKQRAFCRIFFFLQNTITTPNDARSDTQKRKNMAFYDTCTRKGCFFCLRQPGIGRMLCRKKSMPHVET
jgi:hypothetical protein